MPTVTDYTYDDIVKLAPQNNNSGLYVSSMLTRVLEAAAQRRTVPIDKGDNGEIVWVQANTLSKEEKDRVSQYFAGSFALGQLLQAKTSNNKYPKVELYAQRETPYSVCTIYPSPPAMWISDNETNTREQNRKEVIKLWGLDERLLITSNAALFYLLYTRMNRGDKVAGVELRFLMDSLLPQLKNYLDMATAGEARYTLEGGRTNYETANIPKDVREYVATAQHLEVRKAGLGTRVYLVDKKGDGQDVLTAFPHDSRDVSRVAMWRGWKQLREHYGLDAITWCVVTHFLGHGGGGGVSGPLWANAANLVRKHDLKQISDLFFIDQAFSLQHNGGNIFNKLWDCNGLQEVLTYAFKGDMRQLPTYLNDEHKRLYKKVCVEVMFYEGEKKLGNMQKSQNAHVAAAFNTSTVLKLKPDMEVGLFSDAKIAEQTAKA